MHVPITDNQQINFKGVVVYDILNTADCYEILGIQRGASQKEIKNAYRRLSLKYHPDRNKEEKDGEKFKKIIEAYQFLRLEEKSRYKKSDADIATIYAEFWKQYDKKVGDEFQFGGKTNFTGFTNPFGANVPENYSHNQEKEYSHMTIHIILYGGLGLVALWIILSQIFK